MYHEPVLLYESIRGLQIEKGGKYVDATYGGGSHSGEILNELGDGRLMAMDTDPDAIKNKTDDNRLIMVNQNFRYMKNYLEYFGLLPVDGILADLGLSSHQIDTPQRGFSFRFNHTLDMRMNPGSRISALDIVNEYPAEKLAGILYEYGEISNSRQLARVIEARRSVSEIKTTTDLTKVIEEISGKKFSAQLCAQVFQAIRIEVNGELESLKALLLQSAEVLRKGGRLVVISYHSLEDRLVKNFMKSGKFSGEAEKDFFGNTLAPFRLVVNKPITPGKDELMRNNRARSARLRIAERTELIFKTVPNGR